MGFFSEEYKQRQAKNKEALAKFAAARGKELAHASLSYVGGLDPKFKKNSVNGFLYCYENAIYYKKHNNSFTIPSKQIVSFQVSGQQQTNSRISVTRMATLGVFSLAAPKRSTVKEASVTIGLKDGRQVFFHTNINTESDIHSKLANAISFYSSLQTNQPYNTVEDPAKEISKYADLRKKGILTEEEFQAKKKQLLGL